MAAEILISTDVHDVKFYDLSNNKLLIFSDISAIMSHIQGRKVQYQSMNLLSLYISNRKDGLAPTYILVMSMLHFMPGLQKQPALIGWVEQLTSKNPRAFEVFVRQKKSATKRLIIFIVYFQDVLINHRRIAF